MKLNLTTDYAYRVLIYLGSQPDQHHDIETLSQVYQIPKSSLMKIVSELVKQGFIQSTRGRSGGINLARAPSEVNLLAVADAMGERFEMADCAQCLLQPECRLKRLFAEATEAFRQVLQQYSLQDVLAQPQSFARLMQQR